MTTAIIQNTKKNRVAEAMKAALLKQKNKIIEFRKMKKNAISIKQIKIISGAIKQASSYYRYIHIAYSELKGRERSAIEIPKKGNEVDEKIISSIKTQYMNKKYRQ